MKEAILFRNDDVLSEVHLDSGRWSVKGADGFLRLSDCIAGVTSSHIHFRGNFPEQLTKLFILQDLPEGFEGKLSFVLGDTSENQLQCFFLQTGASRVETRIVARLKKPGFHFASRSVQFAKKQQKLSIRFEVTHEAQNTTSDLMSYCVADDQGHSVFEGNVSILESALHSEAHQKNKNLSLSKKAIMDAYPKLMIANSEVKASHGSSTSGLEGDPLIYMQSRGLNREESKSLLLEGFLMTPLLSLSNSDWIRIARENMGLSSDEGFDS